MSSDQQTPRIVNRRYRNPSCVWCRNHGRTENMKGHKSYCPFRRCKCTSCKLTTERKILMGWQIGHHLTRELICRRRSDKADTGVQTQPYWDTDTSEETLSKDFFKLLETSEDHDLVIKCGEHSIQAHKIILCTRSDVFKAMLQSDMLEGRTGIIKIQDIDISYLQDFIRYLYTDELSELTFEKAKILFETGDKYDVKSLMHRCSEYLQDNLSLENIYQCLALADTHSEQCLKDQIVNYILNTKINHPTGDFWLSLCESYPQIANEVNIHPHQKVPKTVQTKLKWNIDGPRGSLSKDLSKLIDTSENYDVVIKCREHSIKAHKTILCARSDVFKARLQSCMLDGRTVIMEIHDIDYLRDLIRFLYTDELPELIKGKAKIFYEIGETYAVGNLVHRCSEYVLDNLSPENVCKWLEFAVAHSDQKLKDGAIKYIIEKDVVLNPRLWLPFCISHPQLSNEVYRCH